jgi:VWFA-related protein
MFARRVFSLLVLAAVSSFSQTRGGGGSHSTNVSTHSGTATDGPSVTGILPNTVGLHSAQDEGKLEFRSESILVQVPVVVTDKSGNHIHGLTKDDFHLLENGKEQNLSVVEELIASNAKLDSPSPKLGEFRNLTVSSQQPHTVVVIAIDTVNTPFLDQTYGRRALVKYLANNLDTNDVLALMIITSHGVKTVQGLTGDATQLLQVLKKISGEMPDNQSIDVDAQADAAAGDIPDLTTVTPSSDPVAAMDAFVERGDAVYAQFQQQNAIETTLNAFQSIAWSLSGLPGRKALVWATGGFPFAISSYNDVPGGYLSILYERTMQALNEAQISVYPVDVRGLVNTSSLGDVSRSRAPTPRQMNNRIWLQQSTIDSLTEFANMTGGKAFYNTNDLATSFKRAADDASSYYLLGYYLNTKNNHAGWRELKVKVDRNNTEVRARNGFFVTNATIHADLSRNSDISYALASPIEGTGVPITMSWLGISGAGDKKKAEFQIRMPPNSVSVEGNDRFNFEFAVAAYRDKSKDGKPTVRLGRTVSASLSPQQLASLRADGIGFRNTLELEPGQYTVRVVIRDNVTGKLGSVTAPLTVN